MGAPFCVGRDFMGWRVIYHQHYEKKEKEFSEKDIALWWAYEKEEQGEISFYGLNNPYGEPEMNHMDFKLWIRKQEGEFPFK